MVKAKKVTLVWQECQNETQQTQESFSIGETKETGHTLRQRWELVDIEAEMSPEKDVIYLGLKNGRLFSSAEDPAILQDSTHNDYILSLTWEDLKGLLRNFGIRPSLERVCRECGNKKVWCSECERFHHKASFDEEHAEFQQKYGDQGGE